MRFSILLSGQRGSREHLRTKSWWSKVGFLCDQELSRKTSKEQGYATKQGMLGDQDNMLGEMRLS